MADRSPSRPKSVLDRLFGGRAGLIASGLAFLLAGPLLAPQALAFPYRTDTAIGPVWSEQELDPAMLEATANYVQQRMATTPLAEADEQRPIFVTSGGWRWLWLANLSHGSLALTRPITKAVVVNRTDPATGQITASRTLGGVVAHEFTHGLIRRRYGEIAARTFPTWKVEGYSDHVGGESTLDAADVAELEANGEDHPALIYFQGRQRVAAELERNGGSVDALFGADE